MKVQNLFLGFALVAVISAAPIEDKAAQDEAEYHPEDLDIDPTQYEKLLQDYDKVLEKGFGDEELLGISFGYGELLGPESENETLLAAILGDDVSDGALGEGFGDDDILLAAALGDESLGETYGYEELLATEMGNETLLVAAFGVEVSVDALPGDEAALEELLNVSEEDEKLMEIALENLNLEEEAAGSDSEIRPDAE